MHNRHRSVGTVTFLKHHIGNRFTDDIRPAYYHHFRAFGFDPGPYDHLLDACRSTGRILYLRTADHKPAHIDRMKPVHILVRIDRVQYLFLIDVLR